MEENEEKILEEVSDNNFASKNASKRKKGSRILVVIAMIGVFFAGCAGMFGLIYAFPSLFTSELTRIEKNVTITDTGIAEAVDKVYNSVVIVSVYNKNNLYGSGTGFVYSKDDDNAYILTNNHVVENSDKVMVSFTDGKVIEAKLVGTNELADIAVLSVDADESLAVAEIGSSENVRVGDTTFTVGAPLDSVYSWTVTRGIISGKDRMVQVAVNSGDYIMKVIQTDAAINNGNSGGPLCNANGEVIGINSLKLVDESVEGMGFAIPIERAIKYADMIRKGEIIVQPHLGTSMLNVVDILYSYPTRYASIYRELVENDINEGVVVYSVEKDSSAAKAGLESGDIITKINEDDVINVAYFKYYLYNYNVGDKITITYIRDGKEKTVTITLEGASKTY